MAITPGEGACMQMGGEMALPSKVFPPKLKGGKIQSKQQKREAKPMRKILPLLIALLQK